MRTQYQNLGWLQGVLFIATMAYVAIGALAGWPSVHTDYGYWWGFVWITLGLSVMLWHLDGISPGLMDLAKNALSKLARKAQSKIVRRRSV